MIVLIIFFILTSLIMLFTARIHGITGAVLLGLNMIAVDFCWQWLRIMFIKRVGTSRILLGIIGGMAVRLISVIVFLKLSAWWLGMDTINFYIFMAFYIFIPLLSLLEARKFKMETRQE